MSRGQGGRVLTDIDLQVMLEEAAEALQDASLQVCVHLLLEQLLHTQAMSTGQTDRLFPLLRDPYPLMQKVGSSVHLQIHTNGQQIPENQEGMQMSAHRARLKGS